MSHGTSVIEWLRPLTDYHLPRHSCMFEPTAERTPDGIQVSTYRSLGGCLKHKARETVHVHVWHFHVASELQVFLSCDEAFRLTYYRSLVPSRCPLVIEIARGTWGIFPLKAGRHHMTMSGATFNTKYKTWARDSHELQCLAFYSLFILHANNRPQKGEFVSVQFIVS